MEIKITIKDIAQKAGVSTGTVDRVLHNRGNVSAKAKKKVLKTIKELNYQKNILASTLAYNKTFHIASLLPEPESDHFWEQPQLGLDKAWKATRHYGLKFSRFHFNHFEAKSFIEQSETVLKSQADAVLLAPLFLHEAKHFLDKCKERNIPVVLINTDIQNIDALCYIGQDSYQSGVLAGKLLDCSWKKGDTVVILHLGPVASNAQHILDKARGLRDFFINNNKKIKVVSYEFEDFNNKQKLRKFIEKNFSKHPDIGGVFLSNSRAHKLIDSLKGSSFENLKIVGFDLIEPNLKYLREGKIAFLINQRPIHQAYYAVLNIADHLILKKTIKREQYLPLDIIVKENVAYYLKRDVKFHIGV